MKVNGKPPITFDSASAVGLGYIGVADADTRVLDRSSFQGGEAPVQLMNQNSGFRTQNWPEVELVGSLTFQQHEWSVTDARKGESV
jgi:hypothetical protein